MRAAGIGYDYASCDIMDDGRPPPVAGNFFAAVHGGRSRAGRANDNNLDELFGFSVTLSMRITVSPDRAGTQQIARDVALELVRKQGFNARLEQLRALLHMNWKMVVMQGQDPASANDNLAAWAEGTVYGFVEPARYGGMDQMRMVGAEWFGGQPDDQDVGVACEMRFDGARRFQHITQAEGSLT